MPSWTWSAAAATVVLAVAGVAGASAATPGPDRVAPTKPTIDGQLAPVVLRPIFTFGATDRRTPRGKIRFRCAFDGAALRPCARIHRPAAALSFGAHTLRVRALDLAGNASRVTSFSFRVVGRWDAAEDFERGPRPANPGRDGYGNTVWSYRYSSQGRSHDPATYELLPTFSVLAPDWEVWLLAPNFQSASVGIVNSQMILHPSPSHLGHNAILAWRSPIATTVRLQATLSRLHADADCPVPANGILWSLDQGNRSLRSGTLVQSTPENFQLTVPVAAGESLYVIVEDRGDSNCDSTGVRLEIETI
jgi:hypothetical protein